MSKKDYIEIAKVLNKAYMAGLHADGAFTAMVFDLAVILKEENPNFDSNRFIKAVSGEGK